MSLATRITDRIRRSIRRRATKALDILESWLLQAPRTAPVEGPPQPLVSPVAAAERRSAPEPRPREHVPQEPLEFPDPDDIPTADPTDLEEEHLAEVHALPAPAAEGLRFEAVEELLEDMVRPALQMDGGDIKLVRVEPEGHVFVELKGACTTCPSATITMRTGIERLMEDQLPGFRSLVEVHGIGNAEDAAPGPG